MQRLCAALSLSLLVGACATDHRSGVYQSEQAQQPMRIKTGVVVDLREVEIKSQPTGAGAAIGGISGGVLAAGDGRGGTVAGIAGAVVGGMLGNMVEQGITTRKGIEVMYRLDGSTEVYALVQEVDEANPLAKGDFIRIIEGHSTSRAVRIAP